MRSSPHFPELPPGNSPFYTKATSIFGLGEFDEAIKAYESYLEKAGKEKLYRAFAMEGLGYSYEGKRGYERAIDAYQKLIDLGEGFQLASAHLGMGRCYEKMGRRERRSNTIGVS